MKTEHNLSIPILSAARYYTSLTIVIEKQQENANKYLQNLHYKIHFLMNTIYI